MSLGFLSGTNAISMQANEKEAGTVCDQPNARKTDGLDCQQRLLHPLKLLSIRKSTSENKNQDTVSVLAPNSI